MLFVIQKIPSDIGIVETVMNNGLVGDGLLGFIQSIIPNLTHRFYSKFKKKKVQSETGLRCGHIGILYRRLHIPKYQRAMEFCHLFLLCLNKQRNKNKKYQLEWYEQQSSSSIKKCSFIQQILEFLLCAGPREQEGARDTLLL